jgi:hypothetical protein
MAMASAGSTGMQCASSSALQRVVVIIVEQMWLPLLNYKVVFLEKKRF